VQPNAAGVDEPSWRTAIGPPAVDRATAASVAATIAAADRSTSASVVDQLLIEIRSAAMPCHVVPPAQQVPSAWSRAIVSRVVASGSGPSTRTSTWLSTTSLSTRSDACAESRSAIRAASRHVRSTRSASPSRPSDAIAA
jgi:hypothetical protein